MPDTYLINVSYNAQKKIIVVDQIPMQIKKNYS